MTTITIFMEHQAALKELGLYTGSIDGDWLGLSQSAMRAFQTMHALPVTGKISQASTDALFPARPKRADADKAADPSFASVRGRWPRQADVGLFYGARGGSLVNLDLPFPMRLAWDLNVIVDRFKVHAKVHDSAKRAFARIATDYPTEKVRTDTGINVFGGCFNIRKMRGGSSWSMHSWAIAIDFDPARNQLSWGSGKARLAQPDCEKFFKAWEAEGWTSLGRARNYDFMHVQAANL